MKTQSTCSIEILFFQEINFRKLFVNVIENDKERKETL